MSKDKEKKNGTEKAAATDLLTELGMTDSPADYPSDILTISIIGSVEGHTILPSDNKTTKYEHLIPQLVAAEENPDVKGLLVILNTVGGDVEAGLALSELISTMSKPVVSLVLGGGHSIGIPLAVSANYSFITASATMTLHPIRTTGLVITAETTFDYMRKTQERVIRFICKHSHADEQIVTSLMNRTDDMPNDIGTILFGQEAVSAGIIDEVGGLNAAMTRLRAMIDGND